MCTWQAGRSCPAARPPHCERPGSGQVLLPSHLDLGSWEEVIPASCGPPGTYSGTHRILLGAPVSEWMSRVPAILYLPGARQSFALISGSPRCLAKRTTPSRPFLSHHWRYTSSSTVRSDFILSVQGLSEEESSGDAAARALTALWGPRFRSISPHQWPRQPGSCLFLAVLGCLGHPETTDKEIASP